MLKYFYEKVFPGIRRYILNNSGTEADAKDVFQDAVMIFYKQVKLGKYKEEYEINGFIYSVSRNLWINTVLRKNKTVALDDTLPISEYAKSASDDLITKEREAFILGIFTQLGEVCKQLLIYSIFDNLSMKEIKEKMGFSSENVAKTKHYKCKQRLISLVKDYKPIKEMLSR